MGKPHPDRANRVIGAVLAFMLAVTMLPAAGLQAAYADEPVERPATSGGDVALESTNGEAAEAAAPQAPVAEEREGGMLAAGGLTYTVADGGLALAGFDGAAPEGALAVPAAVTVDGKETAVVAVDIAEGQVADKVVVLSLPQGVKNVNTSSLAAAFPSLLSVEAAAATGSSLPAAAGAASMRAAYSASGGMLFRPATVEALNEDGSVEIIECKELVWAPPALTVARIPVECRAVAEGAFADVRDLRTVVAFGTMERIAEGAFSTEQMEAAKVVVPQASAAVTDDERVSASMALMGDAGQKERRSAWHEAGWRTDDIVMGKPYGSLTEAVAVTDEGAIERTEMQLVSYPGAHENAMDIKKPNAQGIVEQAESGLAFTVKSDMTASVTWQGDKTATPAHLDIPAAISIDGVTYPVTEIAAGAFEGAAFLASVAIPEGVIAIGQDAFKDCPNLAEPKLPSTVRGLPESVAAEALTPPTPSEEGETNQSTSSQDVSDIADGHLRDGIEPYVTTDDSSYLYTISFFSNAPELGFRDFSVYSPTNANVSFSHISTGSNGVRYGITYLAQSGSGNTTLGFDSVIEGADSGYDLQAPIAVSGKYAGWLRFNINPGTPGDRPYQILVSPSTSRSSYDGPYSFYPRGTDFRITLYFDDVRGDTTYARTNWVLAQDYVDGLTLNTRLSAYARSDHNHNNTYAAISHTHAAGDISSGTFGTSRLADSAVTTAKLGANSVTSAKIADGTIATADLANGAVTADKLADTYARESQFGSIKYEGLEGCTNAGVFPTSYYAGHCPAIPEPVRSGHEFLGWTWHGNDSPTTDAQLMATTGDLFAYPANRTLTANWERETSDADYFFSNSPLDATSSASQTSRIAVSLANEPRTLTRLGFVKNDPNNLFPDYAVWVTVYGGDGYIAGDNYFTDVPLKQLDDGTYGIELEVSLGDGAVDSSSLLTSKGPGSYVADFVTMNYTFA